MSEMKYIQLGNLVELKQGMAINAKSNHLVSKEETPLALLRIADMSTKSKVIFMSENTPKRFIASEDDIIYTRTGQVGLVFRKQQGVVHNNCFRVIPNSEEKLDKGYLYWYLSLNSIRNFANSIASGSAQPDLPHSTFKKIRIWLPHITSQKKIAKILDQYELLIENNNKRIKLLEQMAENLYKEWFLRFRFPGFEDVEFIDGFPKEWKICRIDQLSKIKAGGDAPDDSTKEITDECSIPIYSNGIENEGLYGYTSKAKISKPSITISARGTVGYTCLRRVSYTPIVRLICVIPHEEKLANWLFYYFKRTIVIANGTSQQQITIPMMSREKVLLPTNDLIQKFYEYSTCYLDEIDSLKAQNSNLKMQRDMLLPRLMSGRLEV